MCIMNGISSPSDTGAATSEANMKFTIIVGVNYPINPTSVNHEFSVDSSHQVGAVIGKLIEDEPDAVNFIMTVTREDDEQPT